jgi:hypothetical protein
MFLHLKIFKTALKNDLRQWSSRHRHRHYRIVVVIVVAILLSKKDEGCKK